jgi:hypothetical protein
VHSLKEYELYYFKFKYSKCILSAMESEWTVPYPDVVHCISTARPSGGKTATARLQARLQALKSRDSLKEGFIHLFISSNISNDGILITIFT